MAIDIGYLLFVEILGMTQYPGQPFTGNIYRDLVLFLVVPTIFIILVVYSMTGRIVAQSRLRLLLALGAYMFIVAGGYYSTFALISGPYFIFLIFIMGIVYYFAEHFSKGGGGYSEGGGYEAGVHGEIEETYRRSELKKDLAKAREELRKSREHKSDDAPVWAEEVRRLEGIEKRLKKRHGHWKKYS